MGRKAGMRERKAKERSARRRAEVIIKVIGGRCTASDGADELGVSRKTFYQWENKALAAMAGALEDKDPGRPEPDAREREIAALKERIEAIGREREDEWRAFELREEHLKLQVAVAKREMEKKSGGGPHRGKGRVL